MSNRIDKKTGDVRTHASGQRDARRLLLVVARASVWRCERNARLVVADDADLLLGDESIDRRASTLPAASWGDS